MQSHNDLKNNWPITNNFTNSFIFELTLSDGTDKIDVIFRNLKMELISTTPYEYITLEKNIQDMILANILNKYVDAIVTINTSWGSHENEKNTNFSKWCYPKHLITSLVVHDNT